jgi:hypothetical protein
MITSLQKTTTRNYYLSTANNKEELLPVYQKNITCLQHATKKNYYLSTTNNKYRIITCLQQTRKKNYYLSTTKKQLLPL